MTFREGGEGGQCHFSKQQSALIFGVSAQHTIINKSGKSWQIKVTTTAWMWMNISSKVFAWMQTRSSNDMNTTDAVPRHVAPKSIGVWSGLSTSTLACSLSLFSSPLYLYACRVLCTILCNTFAHVSVAGHGVSCLPHDDENATPQTHACAQFSRNTLTFAEFNMNNLCNWFERIDGSIVHDVKCALTVWLCNILHSNFESNRCLRTHAHASRCLFVRSVGRIQKWRARIGCEQS